MVWPALPRTAPRRVRDFRVLAPDSSEKDTSKRDLRYPIKDKKPYEIPGTNWIMVHGDEQSTKPQGDITALEAAKRHGKSVVCGHTHRQGISSYTQSSGGLEVSRLTGFEVGHMMDTKQAYYTKGTFNWQAGFGVMYVDRKRVVPIAVPIEKDGSFMFEGKVYG